MLSEEAKNFIERQNERAVQGCLKTLRHSRVVKDFQILVKKGLAEWATGKTVEGLDTVRKTHKYVGVLTVADGGEIRHFAKSDPCACVAGLSVFQKAIATYCNVPTTYKKLERAFRKYYDSISLPHDELVAAEKLFMASAEKRLLGD
jgi:hypothetical protein